DESVIDEKVQRILWSLIHSGILDNHKNFRIEKPNSKEIAKKAAAEGVVLLKNENNLLPLDQSRVKKIAVIGPNAVFLRTGGWGSSYICPTETVSPLEGLTSKVGSSVEIINEPGIIRRKDIFPVQNEFLYLPDKSGNGLRAQYYDNPNLDGIPLIKAEVNEIANDWGMKAPEDGLKPGAFSAVYSGWLRVNDSGEYDISVSSDGGCRLYIDDKLVIDTWNKNIRELYREYASVDNDHYLDHYTGKFITRTPGILKVRESVPLKKQEFHKIRLEYQHKGSKAACVLGLQNKDFTSVTQAVEAAKQADVALIYAGISLYEEREGADLPSLYLPEGQEELIKKVAEVNPNTVVILNNGTALLLSEWIENVNAVVEAWYPGQYGGEVIADILFGDINPSGKLPMTFMKKWEDTPVYGYYPAPDIDGSHELDMNIDDAFGNEERDDLNLVYNERIFVGYRHYDKHKIKPLFPFGHGLSYTDFKYDNINTKTASDGLEVSFSLTNIGKHAGSEICQLYLQDLKSSLERPKKELKGFDKVFLEPGETKKVTIRVNKEELAFFHKDKKHWIIEPGRFNVMVGSSSRDLRLKDSFNW
ncbi:MAG: glycoside hydrolase family 3 C-terminal domain-containing protein, partial [Bacteroidota bacterium]